MNKFCVYTCIVGFYDKLEDPLYINKDVDYICFTDQDIESSVWQIRPLPELTYYFSPTLKNRYVKIMSHVLLPEYDYVLYIDGCCKQIMSIFDNKNINDFIKDDNLFLLLKKHGKRTTVQDEANRIIEIGKDSEEIVYNQLGIYFSEGFPDNLGLTQNIIMLKKNKNDDCKKLMDLWWKQLYNYSERDQMSLQYSIWKTHTNDYIKVLDPKDWRETFNISPSHLYKNKIKGYYESNGGCKTMLLTCVYHNNLYIKEFIEYYLNLGITKIVLLDNNEIDDKSLLEKVRKEFKQEYENKKIEIINRRGYSNIQNSLKDIYKKYENDFDWILSFDQDEFFEIPKKYKSINSFLSSPVFFNYNFIIVFWKYYNDNNIIEYENKPLRERFTKVSYECDADEGLQFLHTKYIVRGSLSKKYKEGILTRTGYPFSREKTIASINSKYPTIKDVIDKKYKICDVFGNHFDFNKMNYNLTRYDISFDDQNKVYKYCCLGHYMHKSLEEFIEHKIKNGLGQNKGNDFRRLLPDYFFLNHRNTWTLSKQNYILSNWNTINDCLTEYYNSDIYTHKRDFYYKDYNFYRNDCAICCIGRLENDYIREFVEYHKNLGIKQIFLYDTNNDLEENFIDVIGDYIKSNYVVIIKWTYSLYGPQKEVLEAYNDFIEKYSYMFDWCAFLDIDEHIKLYKHNTINEYLNNSKFNSAPVILLNWLTMDDNDLIYYEKKPLEERFKRPCNFPIPFEFEENMHVKPIVNLYYCRSYNLKVQFTKHTHVPYFVKDNKILDKSSTYYDNNGNLVSTIISNCKTPSINYDTAALMHFRFKTIEEYCVNRKKKLTDYGYNKLKFNYDMFIKYNKDTILKRKVYDKYMNSEQ